MNIGESVHRADQTDRRRISSRTIIGMLMNLLLLFLMRSAETLAVFGWVGFFLRFVVEIFLFFYTKVWTNYYRLLLFFFMFIYQFTGSFITNVAEYVIWILAFTNVFNQFDVKANKAIHSKWHLQQQVL